jgi:H+/Cl- antiporter ClcA
LLRNAALIVTVAWSRWILDATSNVIYDTYNSGGQPIVGFNSNDFSTFLFTVVVGILIGIASVLLIYIVSRSTKGFFKKHEKRSESDSQNSDIMESE